MAQQETQLVLYELSHEIENDDEEDSACWLEAVLRREPASIAHTKDLEEGTEGGRELWQVEEPRALITSPAPKVSDVLYKCSQCGASFNTDNQLKSHTPTIPRKCCFSGCSRPPFKYSKDLRRHINDVHYTTTSYKCPVHGCTPVHLFKRKDNLQRHIRKQHLQAPA